MSADERACRGVNPAVFFPTYTNSLRPDPALDAAAKAICARCPLRQRCLDAELDAMRAGATSVGIFGGTNEHERVKMLHRNANNPGRWTPKPIECGTDRGYQAHRRRGYPPCPDCHDAHTEYIRYRKWWCALWASIDASVMRTLRAAALAESHRLRAVCRAQLAVAS